jgi:hypothetical protein
LRRESYEELPMEEDNSWGKYLFRSNGVYRIILGAVPAAEHGWMDLEQLAQVEINV